MRKKITLILFITIQLFGQTGIQTEPRVVEKVELEKYLGTWYEIAKIPNSFQSSCAKNTTATYSMNQNGMIKVINRCIEEDGEIDEAEGIARITDTLTNAKLEVSFVSFLGWRPFWGAYWIIGLDENYQWAIVGHPEREYGWILSRTKSVSSETKLKIFSILKEQGYDTNKFEMSLQE